MTYDTARCADGRFIAVGRVESQFFERSKRLHDSATIETGVIG